MAVQAEWLEKDYYEVLGVAEGATAKDIQRAYRRLARQYHPDANPGDRHAEERFKEVAASYDVLGDAEKRKEYDELRRLGPMATGFGPPGPGAGRGSFAGFGGFRVDDDLGFGAGDLGDLFGGAFGRARRQARPTATRGRDLEAELHIDLVDAVAGLTTEIPVTSEVECVTCGGNGARPGTTPTTCPACGGQGQLTQSQGVFAIRQACPACGGRGQVVTDPCQDCGGTGAQHRARRVKVRVPAGIDDGQLVRLASRGEPGRNGGPPGDLFVVVRVEPHPTFGRQGADLTLRLPVTYPEAVLGAEVKVPTLDAAPVTVRIPPGTPSGRALRVRGRGIPRPGGGRGDLIVTVEVAVPTRLDAATRRAVEALATALPDGVRAHLEG